jgi:predicted phosphodiesterase
MWLSGCAKNIIRNYRQRKYFTMRIALFSDIHANLPALEAAFAEMDADKPDAVYCLGDLVGYNVWPNEVIGLIQQRGIATIAGNHDVKVPKPGVQMDDQESRSPKKYAYSIVGDQQREYLHSLPAHIRLEFQLNGERLNALFVHGSPRKVDEYLLEDMDEQLLSGIMQQANADILCFGHSHKPYHRIINTGVNGQNYFRHAINIGSVGKPKDNNPKGCYVILNINSNSSATNRDTVQVEFKRFEYDVEKAAKAVEESPLPNELADMLRKGY